MKLLFKTPKKGFTLNEMVLTIALMGIIGSMSLPVYQGLQDKNNLDIATNTIVYAMRQGQLFSQSSYTDSAWSLIITPEQALLFKGRSYEEREKSWDQSWPLPPNLLVEGTLEYHFEKLNGNVSPPGALALHSQKNDTSTIQINEKGMVEY